MTDIESKHALGLIRCDMMERNSIGSISIEDFQRLRHRGASKNCRRWRAGLALLALVFASFAAGRWNGSHTMKLSHYEAIAVVTDPNSPINHIMNASGRLYIIAKECIVALQVAQARQEPEARAVEHWMTRLADQLSPSPK